MTCGRSFSFRASQTLTVNFAPAQAVMARDMRLCFAFRNFDLCLLNPKMLAHRLLLQLWFFYALLLLMYRSPYGTYGQTDGGTDVRAERVTRPVRRPHNN